MSAKILRLTDYRVADVADTGIDLATAVDAAIPDLREVLSCWDSEVARQRTVECETMLSRAFSECVAGKPEV